MSSITRVEGWVSPGYLEQGPDAPRPNSSLPSADITASTVLKPSVERMFSEFKIPGIYSDWKYISYLRVETDMNNGADGIYYGWVDSVDLLSDSDTAPMVLVKWHIDLWRTYLYAADLRQGHIVRKPSGNHPLQGYDYVRRTASKKADLFPVTSIWWVYISANSGTTYKTSLIYCYPISSSTQAGRLSIGTSGSAIDVPSLNETITGRWDELFEIDPAAITGCWVSPVAPAEFTGSGASTNPIKLWGWTDIHPPGKTIGYFLSDMQTAGSYEGSFPEISATLPFSENSTEISQLAVANFDGEVIQEIPVGASLSSFTYRTVVGPTEAFLSIRFGGYILSRSEGLCATIPLPTLDLSENAWSSYVYSGNREFDKEMRLTQTKQSGIQNTASGALGGGIMGGFSGAGALAGAAAGAVAGAVSFLTDYYVFNNEIQGHTDKYKQMQSAGILMSGTIGDIISHGLVPCLISLDFDSYSASQASARDSQFGYSCSEFRSSIPLSTLGTGYWQIQGLNVQGSMPIEAKNYISRRFAAGVRLS